MYCKQCGKVIDDDSKFCRYCGSSQEISVSDENVILQTENRKLKMEVDGEIKATIAPTLPNFTGIKSFIQTHSTFFIIVVVWVMINVLFLVNGDDRNGFWPHIYSHSETIWDYDRLEYNPFSKSYYTGRVGHQGPEETKIDWDLEYYGLSEFLIYAIIIPFIAFFVYNAILQYNRQKEKKPYRFNPSEGLRRF